MTNPMTDPAGRIAGITGATDRGPGAVPSDDDLTAGAPTDQLGLSHALASITAGYSAAHGHPLEHDGLVQAQRVRRRWALGMRAAIIVLILIGMFGVVLAVTALRGPQGVPLIEGSHQVGTEAPAPPQGQEPPTQQPGAEAQERDQGGSHGQGAPTALSGAQSEGPHQAGQVEDQNLGILIVHVAGQVHSPGIVELAAGARVADAVTAAGGLTSTANSDAVNLARVLEDSEQVYIPAVGEEPPNPQSSGPGGGPQSPSTTSVGLVNINTADTSELQTLPGIGPALADRIIAWRTTHGPFAVKTDLLNVSGIGPAVMGNVQDLVTVE